MTNTNQQNDNAPVLGGTANTSQAEKEAYIIGHIRVKDVAKWTEYCSKVPDTVAPWGATLVFRGEHARVLTGEHVYTDTVVIRFPNQVAIDGWHDSAAYQAIVPIREQAADVLIVSYEV